MNDIFRAMDIKRFYQDDEYILEKRDEKVFLIKGEYEYELSYQPYGSCLNIKTPDRKWWTIYQAFSVGELCHAARTNDTIRMITGETYDIRGVFKLIMKALELKLDQMDIGYIEARCFMDILAEKGAVSEETAFDLYSVGMVNPNIMSHLIHSKKVQNTPDGRHYLRKAGAEMYGLTSAEPAEKDPGEPDFRLISNQVRFGVGYIERPSGKQYYSWHGQPNRNDDYITYAEITEEEFAQINKEYPRRIDADRETAEVFRNKYVDGHKVISEGWNMPHP